jgi:phage RecT family recombinase
MARNTSNKRDYAADNAKTEKTIGTALAVMQEKLGSGSAAKYNAVRLTDTLKWQAEKMFVGTIIRTQKSDLLAKTVIDNPISLLVAMQSAASLGLTLDPNLGLAFLIPKRPAVGLPYEVQLKVSYKGMEQAALASGTVTAITTELVYGNDTFSRGVRDNRPYIDFAQGRGERGDLEGCFCVARYANGESHVEWMSIEDLLACEAAANRDVTSPAWNGKFKPEMQKKCCVRRAAKHWPGSPVITRMIHQFDIENPMDFSKPEIAGESVELIGDPQVEELTKMLGVSLPEDRVATWLGLKAKAEGYASIRDVPMEKFDKVRHDLSHRLELFNANTKTTPKDKEPEQ